MTIAKQGKSSKTISVFQFASHLTREKHKWNGKPVMFKHLNIIEPNIVQVLHCTHEKKTTSRKLTSPSGHMNVRLKPTGGAGCKSRKIEI